MVATGFFRYVDGERMLPLVRHEETGGWAPARSNWELAPRPGGFSAVAQDSDGTLALATYDDELAVAARTGDAKTAV